jgi:ribonuclease R
MFSKEQLLKSMRDKVTHPATLRELLRTLRIPREERATFRRQIKALLSTGELVQTKGGRVGLPDKMDLVIGRLETHAGGFGFVIPDKTGDAAPDVYVSAANIKEAMHGDRVLARIERKPPEGRLEGRIIRILERGNSAIDSSSSRGSAMCSRSIAGFWPTFTFQPARRRTRNPARWWLRR